MPDQAAFDDFIRRIRSGDEQAAAALVRQYEPLIRRAVRLRLEDERLRRVFDSTDVCQSVLASFFARTVLGQYDLETPDRLVKLLVAMARNKVATAARRQYSQRRDNRRAAGSEELEGVADPGASPSEQISGQELLERFRASLSAEEKAIAELRKDGLGWAEIASRLGGTAQARRVQLARAIERISRHIGLDELHT
jgi:RNA polymerase sigma-70 factor (ECF subfamily)